MGAWAYMGKVIRAVVAATLLAIPVAASSPSPAQARGPIVASVDKVRIGTYDDFTRVVMHVNVPVSPKLFTLPQPDRLVVDLPRIEWNIPRRVGSVRSRLIQGFRFGLHTPSVSRLVFDLSGPAEIVDFRVTPLTDRVGYELDIHLAEVFRPFDRYRTLAERTSRFETAPPDRTPIEEDEEGGAGQGRLPSAPVMAEATRDAFRSRSFDPDTAEYDALGALFAGMDEGPEPPAAPIEGPAPVPATAAAPPVVVAALAPRPSRPSRPAARIAAIPKPVPQAPPAAKPTAKPKPKARPKSPRAPFRIVLDPGHGGRDPGTGSSIGMREASAVLAFSEELMKLLEADPAYAAFATRRTDTYVALPDRVDFAREKNANLFISIHADWFDDPEVGGAGAYMLSEEDSIESVEKFVSEQDEIAGIDVGETRDDVLRVLLDLERRETQIGSRRFVDKVREALATVTPIRRDFVKHSNFHVLKAPDMPSVLLELGFMSNPEDRKRLTSAEWRAEAALAMKAAIDAWRQERGVREASVRGAAPR